MRDQELEEKFGSGSSYAWPEVSAASVSKSLCLHAQRAARSLECKTPLRSSITGAVRSFVEDYPSLTFELQEPTFELFLCEVMSLDWDSSPGYPLLKRAPTYRDLFKVDDFGRPDYSVMCEMWDLVTYRIKQLESGPVLDPINVFPKGEPHSIEKVNDGRVRLIFGLSFVDNVISAMLFRNWFHAALQYDQVPFKFGWTPQMGGYRYLSRSLPRETSYADKSSWDWTVTSWEITMVVQYFRNSCINWNATAENNLRAVFGPTRLMLSSSTSVDKTTLGVMPSGTFFTIGVNSLLQCLVHRVACLEIGKVYSDPFSIGDDTLQAAVYDESYWEEWRSYGHIIKFVEHSRDHDGKSEFAGHEFDSRTCRPVYEEKHAFRLQHLDPELVHVSETLSGYARLYALDDERCSTLVRRLLGTPYATSIRALRQWYTGLE